MQESASEQRRFQDLHLVHGQRTPVARCEVIPPNGAVDGGRNPQQCHTAGPCRFLHTLSTTDLHSEGPARDGTSGGTSNRSADWLNLQGTNGQCRARCPGGNECLIDTESCYECRASPSHVVTSPARMQATRGAPPLPTTSFCGQGKAHVLATVGCKAPPSTTGSGVARSGGVLPTTAPMQLAARCLHCNSPHQLGSISTLVIQASNRLLRAPACARWAGAAGEAGGGGYLGYITEPAACPALPFASRQAFCAPLSH